MILLRAGLFNIYFFSLTTLMATAGLWVRLSARGRAFALARAWARLVLAGLRTLCGVRVAVTGWAHLPIAKPANASPLAASPNASPPAIGPALLASQHQSAFDTLIWMTLLPATSYVVKHELTMIPLFGPLLRPAGMIPVDRRAGATALRHLIAAAAAALAAGRQIVIFPEGTRVAPGARVKLQPGIAAIAAAANLPVIPVATNSGRHWQRRAFLKYPGTIHVAIGPAIPAGTPRAELMAAIEAWWRHAEAVNYLVDNSVEEI